MDSSIAIFVNIIIGIGVGITVLFVEYTVFQREKKISPRTSSENVEYTVFQREKKISSRTSSENIAGRHYDTTQPRPQEATGVALLSIISGIPVSLLGVGLLGIIAGIWMLKGKKWARQLAMCYFFLLP